jgi:hypothetical protein
MNTDFIKELPTPLFALQCLAPALRQGFLAPLRAFERLGSRRLSVCAKRLRGVVRLTFPQESLKNPEKEVVPNLMRDELRRAHLLWKAPIGPRSSYLGERRLCITVQHKE